MADRTPPAPPAQHHAGSKGTVLEGSEVDLDAVINANPCANLYLTLENCLVETNRSWQKCQAEVRVCCCLAHVFDYQLYDSILTASNQVKALKECSQKATSK